MQTMVCASTHAQFLTTIRLIFFLGLFSSMFLNVAKSSSSALLVKPFENRTAKNTENGVLMLIMCENIAL